MDASVDLNTACCIVDDSVAPQEVIASSRGPVSEEGSGGVDSSSASSLDDPYGPFFGSWADEVEREEALLGLVPPVSDGTRQCCNRYADRLPQRRTSVSKGRACTPIKKKKKKKTKKKTEGFKLFFGGIVFADLEERLFEMEDSIGEEVEPEVLFAAHDTLKKLRIDCLESMFNEFGEVMRMKPNWEKRFCHVVYRYLDDAARAMQVLARADERKKRQEEFSDVLEAAGFPRFAAPLPSFYVRWPRGSPALILPTKSCCDSSSTANNENENESDRLLYWLTSTSSEARWDVLNAAKTTTPSENDKEPTDRAAPQRQHEIIAAVVPLARKEDLSSVRTPSAVAVAAATHVRVVLLPLSLAA